jgi:hypothetical protein
MAWTAILHGGPRDGQEVEVTSPSLSVTMQPPYIPRYTRTPLLPHLRHGHYTADPRISLRRLAIEGASFDYFWQGWDDKQP